jgi:hypothetical protein
VSRWHDPRLDRRRALAAFLQEPLDRSHGGLRPRRRDAVRLHRAHHLSEEPGELRFDVDAAVVGAHERRGRVVDAIRGLLRGLADLGQQRVEVLGDVALHAALGGASGLAQTGPALVLGLGGARSGDGERLLRALDLRRRDLALPERRIALKASDVFGRPMRLGVRLALGGVDLVEPCAHIPHAVEQLA